MATALASDIRRIRAFNRLVAERLGAVGDQFLGRERPLGESRVLWEVGTAGAEVRELRARLGLDSGYLSRVLRSLARARLLQTSPSPRDRRVRRIDLTPAGRAEVAELDRLSDEVAAGFLAPLDERGRQRLVAAMSEVERLLQVSMVAIEAEDPAAADARWCIARYYERLLSGRSNAATQRAQTCLSQASHPAGPALGQNVRGSHQQDRQPVPPNWV